MAVSLTPRLQRVAEARGVAPPDRNIFMHLLVDGVSRYFGQGPLLRRLGGEIPTTQSQIRAHAEIFADYLLAVVGVGRANSSDL
jgi:hypothetical protein